MLKINNENNNNNNENDNKQNIIDEITHSYKTALSKRANWESFWEECIYYAAPERYGMFFNSLNNSALNSTTGQKKNGHIFDSTAINAVENLTANLATGLTPAWSKWFDFSINPNLEIFANQPDEIKTKIASDLNAFEGKVQSHLDNSNFATEIQQCYLDLAILGTACLFFEENQIGENSAFKFKCIPMNQVVIDEDSEGNITNVYRKTTIKVRDLQSRFPEFINKNAPKKRQTNSYNPMEEKIQLVEAVLPRLKSTGKQGYIYTAFIEDTNGVFGKTNEILIIKDSVLENNPFIVFRWLKSSGEIYGRSPVMKALPDIKTANKVVELILQNASLSITGIWQAEDDGIIDLANLDLSPGSIVVKAVGSQGLTPLQTASNFDISQLVIGDLRTNINKALYSDVLGKVGQTGNMTATEVSERTAQVYRALGAVFGRLQNELLKPVIMRAISILRRRGEIKGITINGNNLHINYTSPLANTQRNKELSDIISWANTVSNLGTEAAGMINNRELTLYLAKNLNIPKALLNL